MNECVRLYIQNERVTFQRWWWRIKRQTNRQWRPTHKSQNSKNARSSRVNGGFKVSASTIIARKEEPFDHVNDTDVIAMNDPGCTRLPWPNSRFLSSQVFNAFTICATLSGRCSRTSLILTLPILTSLFTKKSNNEKSPSIALSSYGWAGKAESGTGGDAGCPLIASARRNSAKAVKVCSNGLITRSCAGRWEFAHSMIGASSWPCLQTIRVNFVCLFLKKTIIIQANN